MSGVLAGVVQDELELGLHLGREEGLLADLLEVGEVVPDLLDRLELEALEVLQEVVMDEIHQPVRGEEPGLGRLELADGRVGPDLVPQDVLGQDHAGRLAAQLAGALAGPEDPRQEAAEVVDREVVAGDADELQPLAEEAADQGDPGLQVVGRGQGLLVLRGSSGRSG